MSFYQQYPNTFTGQVTNQVTKNHELELKYLYSLLSAFVIPFDTIDALTFADDLNTQVNGGDF